MELLRYKYCYHSHMDQMYSLASSVLYVVIVYIFERITLFSTSVGSVKCEIFK